MRHPRTLAAILVVFALAPAASARAQYGQSEPRDGVCFYEHPDYGGQYFCESVGSNRNVPPAANDRISSIRVLGNASVLVFQDVNFGGASTQIDYDQPNLERIGWDDRISAFRIGTRRYGSGGGWGGAYGGGYNSNPYGNGGDWGTSWGNPTTPTSGVCFYEDPNYRGKYFCATMGSVATQVPDRANDEISSIRIFGNASVTVYQDVNFQNVSMRFDYDQPNLERVGWDDKISSYRVGARGYESSRNWGGAYGGGMYGAGYDHSTQAQWTYPQAQAMVTQAYRRILGREPDQSGASSWINATIQNRWSQDQLEAALRNTPEGRQRR